MYKLLIAASATAFVLTGASVFAQSKQSSPSKPRTAASIECSRQADGKGLKGKPRKKFRSKCIKDMKKAA